MRGVGAFVVVLGLASCGGAKVAEDAYVSPLTCRGCHSAIFDTYQRIGMGRSFTSTVKAPAGSFQHAASGRRYEVVERDGRIFQRRLDDVFELEATHVVGSGNHAKTFLHRNAAGEFIELPLSWYSQEKKWAMSPGFDNAAPPDFTRIVDDRCLFCHNGYPAADGALAEGIDCQRCHGPGSRHVALAASGKPKAEVAAAIVNPAKLDAQRRDDVCLQCHLETTSSELPSMVRRFGRGVNSFRPGERLADYAVHFDDDRTEKFEVVNQAYRLRQSACFLKSDGRLTCTTCHNAHDVTSRREQCRGCHSEVAVAQHPDLRTADCASCHMPRRRTEDAVHVVMTDHKIQRRPPPGDLLRPLAETRHAGPPKLYSPVADAELYMGVAQIVGRSDPRAGVQHLERQRAALPPGALAVLGEGYFATGQYPQAVEAFTQALAKDVHLPRARYNLAQAFQAAGRTADARASYEGVTHPFPELEYAFANFLRPSGEAEAHYRKAVAMRPTFAEAHGNLGSLLADQGKAAEAKASLELAIRINPALGDAHNNLGRVLAAQGAIPQSMEHLRRAVSLNANDARARYNLARVLQETNSMEAAVAEYRRALAIDPGFAEAHLGLGQTFGDMGRIAAAIVEFREALRLRPGYPEAQQNLNMALGAAR